MRKLFFALLVVASGCDDGIGNGNEDLSIGIPHNFTQINALILQPLCANFSVCHSKDGAKDAGNLNLVPITTGAKLNDPYTALVGKLSDNDIAKGEGKLRVAPCDVDNSFLWIKLNLPEITTKNADLKGTYGNSMPRDNPHLPMEQLQAIRDWIARGAHENEPDDVTGSTCNTDDAAIEDLASND